MPVIQIGNLSANYQPDGDNIRQDAQGAGEATKLAFVQLDQALDDDDEDCPELAESSNSDDDVNGSVRARLNPITNT